MSVTIRIGELVWDHQDVDAPQFTVLRWTEASAPRAPGDETTGASNERRFSIHEWRQFCEETGADRIVLKLHAEPDAGAEQARHLTADDLEAATSLYAAWQEQYPDAQPTGLSERSEETHLVRLRWLTWWIAWALKSCRAPTLAWSW